MKHNCIPVYSKHYWKGRMPALRVFCKKCRRHIGWVNSRNKKLIEENFKED